MSTFQQIANSIMKQAHVASDRTPFGYVVSTDAQHKKSYQYAKMRAIRKVLNNQKPRGKTFDRMYVLLK